VLAHAPPSGGEDTAERVSPAHPDPAHAGFDALAHLVDRLQPPLLLHGHIHPYGGAQRDHQFGRTIVRNVVGRHVFAIETEDTDAS
jgi:Icc-related predicted phosphoesterase